MTSEHPTADLTALKSTPTAAATDLEIRRMIDRLARTVGADHPGPLRETTGRDHGIDPVFGWYLADRIAAVAAVVAREQLLRARGEGASWALLATAMDLRDDDGPILAFEIAAQHQPGDFGSRCVWTCGGCGRSVTDHGPFEGPGDDERGHAPGCGRHRADVSAWRSRTGPGGPGT